MFHSQRRIINRNSQKPQPTPSPSAFGHISGYLVVQHSHIIGMRQLPRRAPRHRRAPAGDGKARQTRAATEWCNAGSDAFSVEGVEASHGQKDKPCGECWF